MAITLQRVGRSRPCLVLWWRFQGRRIERRHFRLGQIQYGGRRPFWKTQMAISREATTAKRMKIRLAIVASQKCEIAQNYEKIWTYSSSQSFKVIEFDTNRKRICDFLLVISSNCGPILHRFWDTARLIGWKLRIFPNPLFFGAPAPHVPFGILRWS